MITAVDIENFLALEAYRSFTVAARQLGVSQPALSMAIRKLEDKVGARLFRRSAAGIEPTPSAEALLPSIRRARNALASVENDVARVAETRLGSLQVACPPSLARDPMAPIVADFARATERVNITVHNLPLGTTPLTVIRAGRAEVALTSDDVDLSGVVVERLGHVCLVAVVPNDAVLPPNPSVRDLLAIGLVTTTGFGVTRRALSAVVGAEEVASAVVLESDYVGLLTRTALDGHGVMFATERAGDRLARTGARIVRPREDVRLRVVAAYLDGYCSAAARRFLEIAQQHFQQDDR